MRRAPALPFLLVTVFIDLLGLGLVVPIAPQLITGLGGHRGSSAILFGLLVASYGLLQFAFSPLLGSLSDRFGRRPVLLASLTFLGLDYLAFAVTPSLWLLLVSRALAGATAGTYTVVNAYIADVTLPGERARAYGLVGAMFSLGFIAGPAVGGALGGISLRLPFAIAAALTLVNVCYGALVLPESHPADRAQPIRWAVLNPGGALLGLVRRPDLGLLAWQRLCADIARQITQVCWALHAAARFGWGTAEVGAAMAIAALVGLVSQVLLVDRCIRWFGERRSVIIASVAWAASLAGCALAPWGWMLYVLLAIGSLGGIAGAASQAWISRLAGDRGQGAVQGALTSVGSLTETAVPIPAAALFTWSASAHAPGLVLLCAAGFLVVAAVLAARAAQGFPEAATRR
jgi:DHA1 family tetracycline resistance protein-like MFS transporter